MSKIWFCPTCGYEVSSRGRCHQCKQRLIASPLPELEVGSEDDEVGYRLDDWTDAGRGRLIEELVDAQILHRFEDDELVVAADDEARVDDLVAEVAEVATALEQEPADLGGGAPDEELPSDVDMAAVTASVVMLTDGARRLRVDPTDMQADGEVAEASAGVFMVERYPGTDPATWAAIGRVTRRLLAALGADEALETEIQVQSSTLAKLLETVDQPEGAGGSSLAGPAEDVPARDEDRADGEDRAAGEDGADEEDSAEDDDAAEAGDEEDAGHPGETVYELPEWLPEQRARLSVLLDEAKVRHDWELGDLIVPMDKESMVEGLFDHIEGIPEDVDDEERYRAIEELFAAVNRLAGDPSDEARGKAVIETSTAVEGPTPLGLDDGQWWALRSRTRTLADAIEHDADPEVVSSQAATLRDLLRALV